MSTPLTVIMPAYNEEEAIREAVQDVQQHVLPLVPGAELLVVNDGSKDRTGALLDEMAAQEPRLRVLHKPNGGHGSALIAGLGEARGEWVFLIDSDRQIPLEHFEALWIAAQGGADAAFGVRRRRYDPQVRLWLTAVIRLALRTLFGASIYDANVPFKLFRRSTWESAAPLIPADTLAPSLFLALYIRRLGLDVDEIDVVHKERETGEVSIKRWKLIKFSARAFRQLLAFRAGLARVRPGTAPSPSLEREKAVG
ncbi:MAG: glycosyltransferase family 2 protein [Gemmatimonadota bacterium]